jgi:hypothetical protein
VPRRTLLFLLALCLVPVRSVFGCSCGGPGLPAKSYAHADLIFIGTVTDQTDRFTFWRKGWSVLRHLAGAKPEFDMDEYARTQGFEYSFAVDRMWRGTPARTTSVLTGRGGGDCGVPFERGETYLVYAHCHKQGDCFTIICSRTRSVEHAAEDLQYLATHKTLPLPRR